MSKATLVDCAEKNEIKKLKELLDVGEDVNSYDYDKTALHSACVSNSIEAAKLLLENGINVNLQDRITQAVPLHYCAVYNYFDMAILLLNNGAKLNISDKYGNEPLWTAIFNVKGELKRLQLVELFLERGANKSHKNNADRSPLDFANQVKFIPLLEILHKY